MQLMMHIMKTYDMTQRLQIFNLMKRESTDCRLPGGIVWQGSIFNIEQTSLYIKI